MGTMTFNAKTSLNLKGSLVLLANDPARKPMQGVQADKSPSPSVTEAEKTTFEEMLMLIGPQPPIPFAQREEASLLFSGPGPDEKKGLYLTEKRETDLEAMTVIASSEAMLKKVSAVPIAGEIAPKTDGSSEENGAGQSAPLRESDAAPLARAVGPEAAGLEGEAGEPPTGKPAPEGARATASLLLREVHPLSDRHPDDPSPLEGTERSPEPVFMKRAHETLKPNNGGTKADGPLDVRQVGPVHHGHRERVAESKEGAEVAAAAPRGTTPGSPEQTLSGLDAATGTAGPVRDHRGRRNTAPNHQTRIPANAGSGDRAMTQTTPEGERSWGPTGQTFPGRDVATETKGPVHDHRSSRNTNPNHLTRFSVPAESGDAAAVQTTPERTTSWGSTGQTLHGPDVEAKTMGPARDYQASRNTTVDHTPKLPARDMFPLRMETPNVGAQLENRSSAKVDASRIEMQGVIDQVLDAWQGVGNDFGRVRVMLNPPNLGSVDLDIIVHGEKVEVVMTAENATIQQALQSRADDIRIALQRQDLKVEGFHVLLQDNASNQQQANSGAAFGHHRGQWARQTDPEDGAPIEPFVGSVGESGTARGLVSIFV